MSRHVVPGESIRSPGNGVKTARAAIKMAAALLTGGMAVASLAGCYVDAGAPHHRTRSYRVAGQVQALVVHGHVGGIQVTGGSSGKVSVTEHITFRHTAPVTTHRITSGTLILDSNCPALETCSVGYDITVPRAIIVRVNGNVGTIRLRSLSGRVTAHTNVGNIALASVSGPVEVTGHAGEILGQDVSAARVTLRMTAGRIDVTFSAAPAALAAATTAGSVTLRVPGGISYAVDASTTVGSTQVSVPRSPASSHAITARTTTGSITIEPAPRPAAARAACRSATSKGACSAMAGPPQVTALSAARSGE